MAKLDELEEEIARLDAEIGKLRTQLERKRLEYDAMLDEIMQRRDAARIARREPVSSKLT